MDHFEDNIRLALNNVAAEHAPQPDWLGLEASLPTIKARRPRLSSARFLPVMAAAAVVGVVAVAAALLPSREAAGPTDTAAVSGSSQSIVVTQTNTVGQAGVMNVIAALADSQAQCEGNEAARSVFRPTQKQTILIELDTSDSAATCFRYGDINFPANPPAADQIYVSATDAGLFLWGSSSRQYDEVVLTSRSHRLRVGDVPGSVLTVLAGNSGSAWVTPLDTLEVAGDQTLQLELGRGGTAQTTMTLLLPA
ncbi:hypothetical protein D1871_16000 [Nakamurella silvestris]|nr:hypothetical protein D1871_16000 [Nakamurella silvestris]